MLYGGRQHWRTTQELICVGSYEVAFVNWCNFYRFDFDWQVLHQMPNDRVYIIDAFIKTGFFANTWIEIKGWMKPEYEFKWNWFHTTHPHNSQLWNKAKLEELQILVKGTPNKDFE